LPSLFPGAPKPSGPLDDLHDTGRKVFQTSNAIVRDGADTISHTTGAVKDMSRFAGDQLKGLTQRP
jgi:hypothetical protein